MIQTLMEQERAAGFPSLAGTDVRGRLPLRERTLNDFLRASGKGLSLQIQPDNLVTVHGLPLAVTVQIDPIASSENGLLVVLRLQGFVALIVSVLGPLIDRLGFAPGSVVRRGSTLTLDLPATLRAQGMGDLIPLIRRVQIGTGSGILMLDFHLHVG